MTTVKTLMTATALAAVFAGAAGDVQARCTWCGVAAGIGAGLLLGGALAPRYAPQPYYAPPPPQPPPPPRYTPPPLSYAPVASPTDTFTLVCGASQIDLGDPGSNDIASINIDYNSAQWSVRYNFINGSIVNRNTQYSIFDYSTANLTQWRGTHIRNPNLSMIGEVKGSGDQLVYNEWLYENGQKTMHSYARCRGNMPPVITATAPPITTVPPVTTAPPVITTPPLSVGEDSIPIIVTDGRMAHASVQVGSRLVTMLLDTGATTMLITRDVADALLANGEAKPIGLGRSEIADGSIVNEQIISISMVQIGIHTFSYVRAGVVENNQATMLFPLTLLGKIGKFTFDLGRKLVIFN
jgi:hypothetical protein